MKKSKEILSAVARRLVSADIKKITSKLIKPDSEINMIKNIEILMHHAGFPTIMGVRMLHAMIYVVHSFIINYLVSKISYDKPDICSSHKFKVALREILVSNVPRFITHVTLVRDFLDHYKHLVSTSDDVHLLNHFTYVCLGRSLITDYDSFVNFVVTNADLVCSSRCKSSTTFLSDVKFNLNVYNLSYTYSRLLMYYDVNKNDNDHTLLRSWCYRIDALELPSCKHDHLYVLSVNNSVGFISFASSLLVSLVEVFDMNLPPTDYEELMYSFAYDIIRVFYLIYHEAFNRVGKFKMTKIISDTRDMIRAIYNKFDYDPTITCYIDSSKNVDQFRPQLSFLAVLYASARDYQKFFRLSRVENDPSFSTLLYCPVDHFKYHFRYPCVFYESKHSSEISMHHLFSNCESNIAKLVRYYIDNLYDLVNVYSDVYKDYLSLLPNVNHRIVGNLEMLYDLAFN